MTAEEIKGKIMETVEEVKEWIEKRLAFLEKTYRGSDDADFRTVVMSRINELKDLLTEIKAKG